MCNLLATVVFEFGDGADHRQNEPDRERRENDRANQDRDVEWREFGVERGRDELHKDVDDTDTNRRSEERRDD